MFDLGLVDKEFAGRKMKVDITFETEVVPDVGYSMLSTELVKKLCKENASLAGIVILFKKLLHRRGLDKSFFGGISSYVLTILAAAFLRSSPEKAIRKCFMGMLEYYGKIFDSRKVAVVGGLLVPIEGGQGNLFVSDPYRPYMNIAYSVTRFKEIQSCFAECHDVIIRKRKHWIYEYNKNSQILNKII